MKKGFTLIELLAVIVILAIIALIAMPIVLNIINDTKESSIIRSADFYINAVENAIALKLLEDSSFKLEDVEYSVMLDGNVCVGVSEGWIDCKASAEEIGDIIEIKVQGQLPNTGNIKISEGKIVELNLIYGTNRVTKEEDKLVLKKLNSTMKNGVLYGDADNDGVVTYADSQLIMKYLSGRDVEINLEDADADVLYPDEKITNADVGIIMQYLNGWDVTLGPS